MSALWTGAAERRRALIAESRFRGIFNAAIRATRGFVHFSVTERLPYHLRSPRTTTSAPNAIAKLAIVVIRMKDASKPIAS